MERGVAARLLAFRDFVSAFQELDIDPSLPVIVHTSLSAFGQVQGGAPEVVESLLASFETVVMPTFTYNTMLVPEAGPPDNAMVYGKGRYTNRSAVVFEPGLPADRLMGVIPETLRRHPQAERSLHPILSFTGVNARRILESQTYAEPLAPVRELLAAGGWVLLLGVGHTANTSIHYAERLAGRRSFLRWALTPQGARECPGFPGCSSGFQALVPRLAGVARAVQIGPGQVQAVPLMELVEVVCEWIRAEPLALLCGWSGCERCNALRLP